MTRPTILQVTDVSYAILAAIGIPANLMTIVILCRGNCGLSKCISFYMVSMATADLLVMLNNVLVYQILKNVPNWFAFEPQRTINNSHWGFQPSLDFYTSPFGVIFIWLQSILLTWIPFTLILLFNSLTVRRILVASRARKELRGHSSENQSDPEIQNRRKSIILLFTVSGTFILLWLTAIIRTLVSSMLIHVRPDYAAPAYIATESGYMLMYLSSCTNTFIYAATQTKFREELKKILKSPWTIILMLIKKNAK